ncbi:hypothetical protein AT239_07545 [Bartonella henselae]|nr:hypothetical protein AT247_05690 [Bartonella henselae]OLL51963.1 hypothetical protein AT241_04500 [Bartonella henselae]OLL53703.1 hypothetical protein AT240_02325 [Bartonella henselae]OLL54507.1 hypothetical protein AT239_07545 [Bartonella henselae]
MWHLDIAKAPGIPGHPHQWVHFYVLSFRAFKSLLVVAYTTKTSFKSQSNFRRFTIKIEKVFLYAYFFKKGREYEVEGEKVEGAVQSFKVIIKLSLSVFVF